MDLNLEAQYRAYRRRNAKKAPVLSKENQSQIDKLTLEAQYRAYHRHNTQKQEFISPEEAHPQVEKLMFHIVVFDERGQIDGRRTNYVRTELARLYVYENNSVDWVTTLSVFQKFLLNNKINWSVRL
jgi:hypothetical protein